MKKRTVQIKKLSRQVTIMYPGKEGMIVHPRLEQSWQVLGGTRSSSSAQGRTVLAGTKSASPCLLKGGALRTGAPGWEKMAISCSPSTSADVQQQAGKRRLLSAPLYGKPQSPA